MKSVLYTIITICFTATFFTGCKDKPCDLVTCAYSGVCEDGKCRCQVGYEGTLCETVMRDKFLGIWNIQEDGSLSPKSQYVASIEKGDAINQVKIYNIQNVPAFKTVPAVATIKHDTITIPFQTMPDGTKIEGWGFIKSTNSLDQHYYQHAVLNLYYQTINPIGQVNKYSYGSPLEGDVSQWNK